MPPPDIHDLRERYRTLHTDKLLNILATAELAPDSYRVLKEELARRGATVNDMEEAKEIAQDMAEEREQFRRSWRNRVRNQILLVLTIIVISYLYYSL